VPWPLTTELLGATEPGARVRHAGRVVEVALDGTFRVPAVLAPWPQPIEVRALDPAGNMTVSRIDVVGGIDYRRLPWAPILLGALLVGAAVGGRLAGRGGVTRGSTTATGVEPWNEIEDGPVRPLDPLR
jgi:hypothetical protein